MKITTNILTIAILLTLIACKQTQFDSNGINKVTVAFSGIGCESKCPFQVLSIDENLNATYYGGQFSKKKGYFKGIISHETWDSIQNKFNKFIVNGIDTFKLGKTDHPKVEFFVHDKFRKHRIRFEKNTGEMSNEDLNILYWFINIAFSENLKTTDSLTFESTFQFSIPLKTISNK